MPHVCRHRSPKTRLLGVHNTHWWTGPPVEAEDIVGWARHGRCEYGRCFELQCPICGANKYGGWGDIDCPCDDRVPNHEERRRAKVAVKPSLGTNGKRRRRRR